MLIDNCDPQEVPLCSPDDEVCCTTRFVEVILENQVLQDKFSDRAAVRRILGNLQIGFNPDLAGAADVDEQYTRLSAAQGSLYVQLLVRPVNSNGDAELPPDIWNATSVIEGFSESKAKKTWWHHWNPFSGFRLQTGSTVVNPYQPQGVFPRMVDCATQAIDQCVEPQDLTSGTGKTWQTAPVPGGFNLSGECDDCGDPIDLSAGVFIGDLHAPSHWNFQFDVKKRIALREDEQLILDFQFRSPFTSIIGPSAASLIVFGGGIKTLIEF